MLVYAWILLALYTFSVLYSPWLVGERRPKSYPASSFVGYLLVMPLFGRMFGWW